MRSVPGNLLADIHAGDLNNELDCDVGDLWTRNPDISRHVCFQGDLGRILLIRKGTVKELAFMWRI